jgi:hypothetical protein
VRDMYEGRWPGDRRPGKSPLAEHWDEKRPLIEFTSRPGCHEEICYLCNVAFNGHLPACPTCC